MGDIRNSKSSKVSFVESLKILSILSAAPTQPRMIIHQLALQERTFYRRINQLRDCGVKFTTDRYGRYSLTEIPAWISSAAHNIAAQVDSNPKSEIVNPKS